MADTRNVIDRYKGKTIEEIAIDLDSNGIELEIAVENTERDFNMGTIVRSANAFGVRHVHVIGRKQWNKRGAMMTDKYLHIHYYPDVTSFVAIMNERKRSIVAVDNISGSVPLASFQMPRNAILVFGQEGPGISDELAQMVEKIVAIEQFGSTRSINVGVAAGIAMYQWVKQNHLHD
jgi:tRNA G18 (ribose-2'-O)-methylase SpoU